MKLRIKFSKEGPIKFIGHLDVMRYFQKALRRAGIDVAYSGGFSPHQIMSFAAPLSVGFESEGEYFDIQVNSLTDTEDVRIKLNAVMAEGIKILKVSLLPEGAGGAMASVAAASYLVSFRESVPLPENWRERLLDFYAREHIPVIKKTKRGEKEMDLKEGIFGLRLDGNGIYLLLDAGSGSNIRPGFVMETFFAFLEVPFWEYGISVRRLETYQRNDNGELVPLIP